MVLTGRMVCSTAWSEDYTQRPNLFTVGFDRAVIGWSVQQREAQEEREGFRSIAIANFQKFTLSRVALKIAKPVDEIQSTISARFLRTLKNFKSKTPNIYNRNSKCQFMRFLRNLFLIIHANPGFWNSILCYCIAEHE